MTRHATVGMGGLLKFLRDYGRDYVGAIAELHRRHGETVYLSWPARAWMFFEPDDIQEVLQKKNKSFPKDEDLWVPANQGVLVSEGSDWRRQRKSLSPIFRESNLAGFLDVINRSVQESLVDWSRLAESGKSFDVFHEINRMLLRLSSQLLFGYDIREDEEAYIEAFRANCEAIVRRYTSRFQSIQKRLPVHWQKRSSAELFTDDVARKIVEHQRHHTNRNLSAIPLLTGNARPQNRQAERQLYEEVSSLLNATFGNTAVSLAWTMYLLGRHPSAKQQLVQELDNFPVDDGYTVDGLSRLPFTQQVINESMRLYPSIPLLKIRRAEVEEVVNGCRVKRGDRVVLCPWVTHRNPRLWRDADQFQPARFADQGKRIPHPFAFFPFGDGPRSCPGNYLAILELKLILSELLRRFDYELDRTMAVEPRSHVLCRPHPGVFIRIWHRQPAVPKPLQSAEQDRLAASNRLARRD